MEQGNDENDPDGCIFTQNLLVEDATAEEIDEAVAGAGGDAAAGAADDAAAGDNAVADAAGAAATDAADAAATDVADAADAAATEVADAAATDAVDAADAVATDAADADAADDAAADATAVDATAAAATACAVTAAATATPFGVAADNSAAAARSVFSRRFRKRAEALGSCPDADPTIAFGAGFDGREEESFQPNDLETFDQGSAQDISIIADFICGQLEDSCGASEEMIADCEDGADAASQLEGQDAADAFNAAIAV